MIDISYTDTDTDFTIEFSRIDRNNMPKVGMINGTITKLEFEVLEFLRMNKNVTIPEVVDKCGKSMRTVNRINSSLKSKKMIERIGSNKTGYWKTV